MTFFRKNNHMFRRLGLAGKISAALVLGAAISNEAMGQIVNADQLRNPVVNDLLLINTTGGSNVNSGDIQILSGFATGTGNSGNVFVGSNTGATGGDLSLGGGFSSTAMEGGDVIVFSGGSGAAGGRSGSILMNRPANSNGQITMGLDDPTAPTIPFAPDYQRPKLAVSSGNIAHVESGTFGLQGTEDIWATLGGPAGISSLAGNYGLRLNSGLQSANIFLNGSGNNKNLFITVSDDNGDASNILFGARNNNDNPGQPRELMRIANNGNVGIGTPNPSNRLTVNSGASIGSSFVNTTAPSNGLIVAGNTGIGTSSVRNRLTVSGASSIGSGFVNNTAPSNGLIVQGQTGIGITSASNAQLYVRRGQSPSTTELISIIGESTAGGDIAVGIRGLANNGLDEVKGVEGLASGNFGTKYGVEGTATGAGTNFGVYGAVNGTSTAGTNYAVFGEAGGTFGSGSNFYAGYFNGNVTRTGTDNFTSDRKFKEKISSQNDASEIIKLLNPVTYYFNSDEEYSHINLDRSNLQHGFIAQELQGVLPELVSENVHPAQYDSLGNRVKERIDYLGVNYIGLISILTSAIQDQQIIIDSLISAGRLGSKKSTKTDRLQITKTQNFLFGQNRPNPFSYSTIVDITANGEYSTMEVWVTTLSGKSVKKINAYKQRQVEISKNGLESGIYLYSLVVDGDLIDTKKMIVD